MAKAVQEIRDLRGKVRELESLRDAPIAIVGMGLRMPGGVNDGRSFWQLLSEGRDATSEVPASRWAIDDYYDPNPDAAGKMGTRRGAFVDTVDDFDAAFFGISPREARSMDPQQRLLMEVVWESLEHAGISAQGLFGRAVGVYVGICSSMHTCNMWDPTNLERIDAYHGTGATFSVAAGRISHFLGLTGPALAVDTACSSSLVALHQACLGLRSGECELALAGGVNLLLGPQVSVSFTKARMLSPDGRCKAFAASADGYGRGEGCGVVVLRRLSDALERRERVLGVVRGSALNHDGHASSLTVPNGPAQVRVIRAALRQAGLSPEQVSYVEAHGTGTPLGDPIEVNALAEVFCTGRTRERPLALGSVKANIGHLEAAAGISGLIKVLLALQHGTLPPHPMFGESTPHISWRELAVELPSVALPWLAVKGRRIAGVSSFGFSGTNAHVIVEEAPPAALPAAVSSEDRPLHLLALSARSAEALHSLAVAYAGQLATSPEPAGDVVFTANVGRAHFGHRLCAIGASSVELSRELERAAQRPAVASGSAPAAAPALAFLFTGQGSQTAGLGRALYATQPSFRQCVDRCAEVVDPLLPRPIREVMFDPQQGALLRETAFTQPALFILEYALAELWRSWGVRPLAVLGHSLGEYVAACVAGVMSARDALRLVVTRGRLMQALPAAGSGDPEREPAMVAVSEEPDVVARAIAGLEATVAIAAINGPQSTVLSGLARDVRAVAATLAQRGVRVRPLAVSHAFHSPLIEPMLDELEAEAGKLALAAPAIPLVANLHGGIAAGEVATAHYWRRHAREPVQFARGVRTLAELGCNVFLELGPRPALIALAQQSLEQAEVAWVPTLSGGDEWRALLEAVAGVYGAGVNIDWVGFEKDYPRQRITLPTYPFERRHYPAAKPALRSPLVARERSAPATREAPAWFHSVSWEAAGSEPAPAVSARVTSGPERWLICADRHGLGFALAQEVRARGGSAHVVSAAECVGSADVARVLAELDATGAPSQVVHLGSLDAGTAGVRSLGPQRLPQQLVCVSALQLAQAVLRHGAQPPRLAFVTAGAVAVGAGPVDPWQASLWGFVRSLGLERPELPPTLLDLDPERLPLATELYEALCAQRSTAGAGCESELALHRGERLVPRLRAIEAPPPAEPLRSDATYLVTGGTGALGLATARRLAALGARHLLLMSRGAGNAGHSGVQQSAAQLARELGAWGVRCELVAGDVVDAQDVARVIDGIRRTSWPLRGVFHAAGVTGMANVLELDVAALERVLAPKCQGAWNLHEACAGEELDHFIAYSSLAAVWGARSQSHYAAANAFLDGLCAHRRVRGEPAVSIQWGPWDSDGMGRPEQKRAFEALGIALLPPEPALVCLERALQARSASIAVADVDWVKLRAGFEARGPRPFFQHLGLASPPLEPARDAAPLALRLAPLASAERRQALITFLRAEVQSLLETEQLPDREQGLFEMGFDSLMAVELARRLERALGRRVLTTLIFDHPRISALAAQLLTELSTLPAVAAPVIESQPAKPASATEARSTSARAAPAGPQSEAPAPQPRAVSEPPAPLAIIGLGCRFPGGADSSDAFWTLLREGRDVTGELPRERQALLASGRGPKPGRGGYLTDVAGFDPWFFRISPRAAAAMDPQHRLLLEVAWEALEDAAFAPPELSRVSTGVFVGITSSEYATLLLQRGGAAGFDGHCVTGTPLFSAAGRLSYNLGLQGPSMSLDTACSSSLTAVHLAGQSLRQGECRVALAAGVNLLLAPETTSALQRTGALSAAGRCKSFAADADGYARSEGCGVLVLMRLEDALSAGYRVRAILRHSGVNHNGASGGYTVPNGRAQEDLIRRVWREARVAPADVDYVEAHATATPLGDPIEVRALAAVVGSERPPEQPLLIGSVKTNLGHCESAAGVAGVIKTVLSLEHEELPRHLHCESLSHQVPWAELSVRVTRESMPWRRSARPRLAGVSSFGMGGTNAHVLLEEAPRQPARSDQPRGEQLLCLSARSHVALRQQAHRLREHLLRHPDLALADVAHTTRIGRAHHAQRAALCAADTPSLLAGLEALLAGREAAGLRLGAAADPLPRLAFLFASLESAQRMDGARLYESSPSFRAAIDDCMPGVGRCLGITRVAELWRSALATAQAARVVAFCTAYALAQRWRAYGLTPDVLAGEGGGEQVAACLAGSVPLTEMLAWLGSGGRGVVPTAGPSSIPLLAPSALQREWHVIAIDAGASVDSASPPTAALAELYVHGFAIDWTQLSHGGAQRVSLPTYPFERRAYWIEEALAEVMGEEPSTAPLEPAALQPAALQPALLAKATLAPALQPALLDPATLAPATLDPATLDPATLDPATLEAVMLQQIQVVSRVLEQQLAFLQGQAVIEA
jgi:epothilone polyketide synthase D